MKSLLLSAVAVLAVSASGVQAAPLYGAEFGNDRFHDVDTATGTATLIGNSGNTNVGDLTSDTRTSGGPVWGVDTTANELATFDTMTGGITSTLAITGTAGPITSIAFDPVTGMLFGNETLSFGGGDTLYTIDTGSGAATAVGSIGFDDVFALGFSQTGRLFGIDDSSDEFLAIDTTTALGTSIGSTGLGNSFDIASDPMTDIMYLVDSGRTSLFTVDTGTAAVSLVGPWGPDASNIAGLAFAPVPTPIPIPIPGVLLLGGLGALYLVRRGRAA